jgi:predicted esterase
MPENIPAQKKLPLILVIDPHGDGQLGTEKFTEALTDIPAIIAGSEKLRNNIQDFGSSLSHLMNDVLVKYPVDQDQIIVAGFSGGARMAYYYGMSHNVLGIIMFGAGPGRSIKETGYKRISLSSGTRDFNFMEQYLPPFRILYDEQDYMVDYFRGKHEWPPPESIYASVAYVLKDEPGFPVTIPVRISEKMLLEYDRLKGSNDLFFAAKALEKAWIFAPDHRRKEHIARTIDEFKNTSRWLTYQREFEGYLQKELRLKQAYVDKLTDPETSWWKKEIQSVNQNLLSCSDPLEEDFLYRLKGFIGIILYSQINTLLQKDLYSPELDRMLVIYEMAEPESPDLAIFKQRTQLLRKMK